MDAATTDDVRFAYIDRKDFLNFVHKHDAQTDTEIGAEFDAWLADHDREVQAQAFEAAAARVRADWAPHRCPWVGFLDDEATRIRKGH